METKTVALRKDAYEILRSQKRPGETFSDVVVRLAGKHPSLSSFAGAWKDMPDDEFEEVKAILRRGRELDRKRMDKLLKRSGM
jgi:predicted CopG family antitoxin